MAVNISAYSYSDGELKFKVAGSSVPSIPSGYERIVAALGLYNPISFASIDLTGGYSWQSYGLTQIGAWENIINRFSSSYYTTSIFSDLTGTQTVYLSVWYTHTESNSSTGVNVVSAYLHNYATMTVNFGSGSSSGGGSSGGDDEEEEKNYFSKRRVVSTNITSSKSSSTTTPEYSIDYVRVKVSQASQIDVRVKSSKDTCLYYKLGTSSSSCNASISDNTMPLLNWSKMIDKKSSGATETTSFTMMDGDSYTYAEIGWYEYSGSQMSVDYEITITPLVTNYTITPHASTGIASVSGGGVIQSGSNTSITATPKNGYQFSQWVDEAGTPYDSNPLTIPNVSSNKEYWASAEPIEYTIEYVDDKQGTTTAAIRKTYTIETATFSLHTLTKTGYTFNGWYTTSTFTGTAVTQIKNGSTENKKYYAKWTLEEYSITYNLNSGSLPTDPAPLNKYTVETETYTLPIPTRTNYEFQGWYENSGLTGTAVTQITNGSTGNKTYYAKWKLKNYTISYNMNGGSGTIASHYSNGTTFTPSTTIPTKTGQAFIGWNTSSSATIAQYKPGENATVNSDLTLYAIWKPLITFKWTDNDYETHKTSQYLNALSPTKDVPSNYHVSQAEVQRLLNLIKTYCETTITIDEKRLATLYNSIATALRNSSPPEHYSNPVTPTTTTLPDVAADNIITVDDFLKLENAFNNRKFI